LPDNVWEMPPRVEPTDDRNRRDEELLSVVPRARNEAYDPYEILNHVLDHDSIFEIAPLSGQSTITALAHVNGYPVGVVIKNRTSPSGGAMDAVAGEKLIRFLQLCDTFHLPMVHFVDELGFVIGLESEKQGIVRTAARVVQAIYQTKMPCISFIVRQLYGVAGGKTLRPGGMVKRYAWPSVDLGSMNVDNSVTAASHATEVFSIEGIIDPRDTRSLLCDFIEAAQPIVRTQLGPGAGPGYRP